MSCLRMSARVLLSILFAVAICLPALAQSVEKPEPSLGEVARQKPTKKAKLVITNENIPRHEPDAADIAAAAEESAKDAADAEKADKEKTGDNGEKSDPASEPAAKAENPEQKLKDARNEAEALRHTEALQQELYNSLRDRLKNESDTFRKEVLEDELRNADDNMKSMRQRREKAEKQVSELEAAAKQKNAAPPATENAPAAEQ